MPTKKKILFILLGIVLVGVIGILGFYCGSYLTTGKNPTYQQVLNFLEKNKDVSKPALSAEYDQMNFSQQFRENAQRSGLKVGIATLSMSMMDYYLNVFNTKDKGLIYVDPQTDKIVTVQLNKSYWEQNGFVPAPTFDTKILKVRTVIW